MAFIIQTNASQGTDILISDLGFNVPASGGSVDLDLPEEIREASDSQDLRTLATDQAFGAGPFDSTLILNDGVDDIPAGNVSNFLLDIAANSGERRDNFSALVDPLVSDDSRKGYGIGSRWINTVTNTTFNNLDAATGAALWSQEMGETGPQGLTGPQGISGIQGMTGVQGPTGLQGITGPQGFTGVQGPTGEGASNLIDLYDLAGGIVVAAGGGLNPSAFVDITWDTEREKDSGYTHAANSSDVTFNRDGRFRITYEISCEIGDASTSRSTSCYRLVVDTGGGFTEVPGTQAYAYHRTDAGGNDRTTAVASIVLDVNAGDIVKVQGQRFAGAAQIDTLANGSRFTIEFVDTVGLEGPTGPQGPTGVPSDSDLPAVQVRDSGNLAIPTIFTDITFDTTDIENNTAILEHDNTNTDNILIKETGLYKISFQCSIDADAGEESISMRVRVNDTTVIPGSLRTISEDDEINDIGNIFFAELNSGDFITYQILASGAGNVLLADSTYTVERCRGAKGDVGATGPAGGPTGPQGPTGPTVFGNNFLQNEVTVAVTATLAFPTFVTANNFGGGFSVPAGEAGLYAIQWFFVWGTSTAGNDFIAQLQLDAVNVIDPGGAGEFRQNLPADSFGGTTQRGSGSGIVYRNLTAGAHTLVLSISNEAGVGTTTCAQSVLSVWRVS